MPKTVAVTSNHMMDQINESSSKLMDRLNQIEVEMQARDRPQRVSKPPSRETIAPGAASIESLLNQSDDYVTHAGTRAQSADPFDLATVRAKPQKDNISELEAEISKVIAGDNPRNGR